MNQASRDGSRALYCLGSRGLPPKVGRFGGIAGVCLAFAIAAPSMGQQQPVGASPTQSSDALETIVVSGSRINDASFQAPTPVTVVTMVDMENRGVTNVADLLNEIPSFQASSTPATSGQTSGGVLNEVNLRGLGANRTLVLVDGRRYVPTGLDGTVDLNVIPQAAISRVEVVTGGASAAWGSDAVAGVVNVLLNHDLHGVQANVQYGGSRYGDDHDVRLSLAFGNDFADNRGSFIVASEYETNGGIPHQSDRPWGAMRWGILSNPSASTPANLISSNVNLAIGTTGGVILYPAPIANIQFGPGGTLQNYNPGLSSGEFAIGGDGANLGQYQELAVPYSRESLYTHVDYKLNDSITAYVEGSYAQSRSVSPTVSPFAFPITIQSDNAFIPAALQSMLAANGLSSFDLWRVNRDMGTITAATVEGSAQTVLGVKGTLPYGWTWDAYYQYGRTDINTQQLNNLINANFAYAADAVVNPANGQVVCRATLSGQAPGCVPLNLFGYGSPSAAAISYVEGTEFQQTDITQEVAAISGQGKLFELNAKPVLLAVGAEYRREYAGGAVDSISQNSGFLIGNFGPIVGDINVKEGFAELDVPLLHDLPFAHSLDMNGALRYTDYSVSGTVSTWKGGLTYEPIAELKLRGTVSRDIRAPSLVELYTPSGLSFSDVSNPTTGNTDFARVLTGGNTQLRPEDATTDTFGFVYQPSYIYGLSLSVDWYHIDVRSAITTVAPQDLVNFCAAGNTAACDAVVRNSAGTILQINQTYLNIGEFRNSGTDIELRYSTVLPGRGDRLTFRALGTFVDHLQASDGQQLTDVAGAVGIDAGGLPHWRWNGSAEYDLGKFGAFANVRFIGGGKYNNYFTTSDLSNLDVPAVWYFNTSARYALGQTDHGLELYGGINNVFDKAPPITPQNFIEPWATNPQLYDVVGRYFYAGIRARF